MRTPDIRANINPIHGLPVIRVNTIATKAPIFIIPSSAILLTPVISLYTAPNEAKIRGSAEVIVNL
ncbi:hypothetical protein SDC9_188292 [bioreactor metagenome]|uniref:Uncharacterized protein n=1 Tax=bioreactor metagenome TaxID=1076179 RepID=A0A645HZP8_9ZZZZ